jgi:hypothetical protein
MYILYIYLILKYYTLRSSYIKVINVFVISHTYHFLCVVRTQDLLWLFSFSFLFWQYWGLNSGLQAC